MNKSLQSFKGQLREHMLRILWSGWAQLGVAGYSSKPWSSVVDVESMILTTCFWGRYDQRLFDEMVSWLVANERFINIQRLQSIIKKETFHEFRLLGPVCRKLARKNQTPKWRGLENRLKKSSSPGEPGVFLLPDNKPLPITGNTDEDFAAFGFLRLPFENRGLTSGFSAGKTATLQLQLRAFFGVCSRAEIMLALLMNNSASISDIATGSYYSWKSIQDALFEMSLSGLVTHPLSKRERRYSLAAESWRSIFLIASKKPFENFNWCKFFSAMEILWQALESKNFNSLPSQTAGIELASLVESRLQSLLLEADSRIRIPDYRTAGENYCKAFTTAITTTLSRL